MEREEHREKLKKHFSNTPDDDTYGLDIGSLQEALHSMNELGLWPDNVDSVSEIQAMLRWRIVEKVKFSGFPDKLRM